MTTMLDFYREHGISPVTQDITDLEAHFARRAHLYRSLGLWPNAIRDSSVLEIGPGSGENAEYIASRGPNIYVLVEPNAVGAEQTKARLKKYDTSDYDDNGTLISVHQCQIDEYRHASETFDIVLCEGLLGLCGSNPTALLDHVARHVAVGGVLIITCIDAISDHAEVLRRALAQRYINKDMSLQEKVNALIPVFTPHLATLKGMTRSVEDWILDNILNPASIGPTFSIPDALTHLEGRFEVLGCSPRFLMDWRWYKEAESGNAWAIESYWKNAHNLFDYRLVERENTPFSRFRMQVAQEVRDNVAAYERGDAELSESTTMHIEWLEKDIAWFGRGQQYLSLVRVQ
jgi:SAM-dependent methyltransferase